MHIHKKFRIETLKLLRHVSILRSSSRSHTFLAKVTIKISNWLISLHKQGVVTPDVNYSWRTAPLTSKVAFLIFIQQI